MKVNLETNPIKTNDGVPQHMIDMLKAHYNNTKPIVVEIEQRHPVGSNWKSYRGPDFEHEDGEGEVTYSFRDPDDGFKLKEGTTTGTKYEFYSIQVVEMDLAVVICRADYNTYFNIQENAVE